jgi:hypothetical protein
MTINIQGCGLDSVGAVTISCEYGDEPSGSSSGWVVLANKGGICFLQKF